MSAYQDCGDRPGFFIPYRYRDSVRHCSYPPVETLFRCAESNFAECLQSVEEYDRELLSFGGEAPAPRFEQDWFGSLDMAVCYALVRNREPTRIVEIGSGHSTRVMSRAILDGKLDTRLICMDPQPRASIEQLAVEHHARPLRAHDHDLFAELDSQSVLFIDSSHLAQPGTDVDILINCILPGLPAGTIVHFHDIFLPDPYPEDWNWRGYNEQLLVAPLLSAGAYCPLFASHYVRHYTSLIDDNQFLAALPRRSHVHDTSLWLEKLSPAII